jgi:hypothetical protein
MPVLDARLQLMLAIGVPLEIPKWTCTNSYHSTWHHLDQNTGVKIEYLCKQ